MSNGVRTVGRFVSYRTRLLLVLALGTVAVNGGVLVLSPLLPTITERLSISSGQAGLALTVMWGLVAVAQYPGGRFADELTTKTTLVGSLVLLMGGFWLADAATSYAAFLLALMVVGTATGLYPVAAMALVADLYVAHRGRAFGLLSSSAKIGGLAASGLALVVISTGVWHAAFVPLIGAVVLTTVMLHWWTAEPYEVGPVHLGIRATSLRLLRHRRARLVLVAFTLQAFAWQGSISFLPTYLTVDLGMTATFANGVFALIFVVSMVINLLAGLLGDRLGYTRVSRGAAFVTTAGFILIVLADRPIPLMVGIVLFAIGIGAFWPALSTYLIGIFPEGSRAGDFGASRSVFIGIGSLGPAYVGLVAEYASFTVAFIGLTGCFLAAAVVTTYLVGASGGE